MDKTLFDKDLGTLTLTVNARAKRVIVRYREGHFRVTHPAHTSLPEIEKIVMKMKPRLMEMKDRAGKRFIFSPEVKITTLGFVLSIKESGYANYYASLSDGKLTVVCPEGCRFEDSMTQQTIKNIFENHLRAEAKRILPGRVKLLSEKYGFAYASVKINQSRTRWGSCSARKNINLSYRCLLLPAHLADLIMLHELCHTIEMNHGERFWALLNKVTDGNAKSLTSELGSTTLPY